MATLKIRVPPTVSRALAEELFTLILKMLQITNQETIKNCLLTSSFTKTDDCTNTEDNLKSKPQELCTSFICQMKCKLRPRHK